MLVKPSCQSLQSGRIQVGLDCGWWVRGGRCLPSGFVQVQTKTEPLQLICTRLGSVLVLRNFSLSHINKFAWLHQRLNHYAKQILLVCVSLSMSTMLHMNRLHAAETWHATACENKGLSKSFFFFFFTRSTPLRNENRLHLYSYTLVTVKPQARRLQVWILCSLHVGFSSSATLNGIWR